MFGFIKKIFIRLLPSVVFNASTHTKCVSLSNQKCEIQPTLINLHPTEYSQELYYYPFAVKLDRCVESCYALNDLTNKVCVPNKTENFNLRVFNMITGINESKTLTMNISCKSKCDCIKCDSNQKWNNDNCRCEFKNPRKHCMYKNILFGILLHVAVKNGKYLASIIDDSVIMCDEVI